MLCAKHIKQLIHSLIQSASFSADGPPPGDEARIKRELSELSNLAPGDFAAAKRRIELMGETATADDLLKTLKEESALKPDGRRKPISFAHTE